MHNHHHHARTHARTLHCRPRAHAAALPMPMPPPVPPGHARRAAAAPVVPLQKPVPHLLMLRGHQVRKLRGVPVRGGVEARKRAPHGVPARDKIPRVRVEQVCAARSVLRDGHEAVCWVVCGVVVVAFRMCVCGEGNPVRAT